MRRPRRADARANAPTGASLDFLCFSARDGRLTLLAHPATGRSGRAELPWRALTSARTVTGEARRLAADLMGSVPLWMTHVATLGDGTVHPSDAPLSLIYAAVVAAGTPPPAGLAWANLSALAALPARQRQGADLGLTALRERMDREPIAFRLLDEEFTLSALQAMYELLLGQRLHKASFRRALQAAGIVSPTDSWRSEGRGRPAQLYRYAPPRRRSRRRPVRFDLLG